MSFFPGRARPAHDETDSRPRPRRRGALLAAGCLAGATLFAAVPLAGAASAQAATASLSVVHGLPNVAVDVYINNERTLANFRPETVTAPLALAPGSYTVDFRRAGDPAGARPAAAGTATLPAGANMTLAAHLTSKGEPTLTTFRNETAGIPAGKARLIVRHTAAAPQVDFRVGGRLLFPALDNGVQRQADLAPGAVELTGTALDTGTRIVGPTKVTLPAGTTTVVYSIGLSSDNNLSFITQRVSMAPVAANAGTGGQVAREATRSTAGAPVALIVLLASAGTAVLFVTTAGARRLAGTR
jgi:hypothetical protein